MHPALTLDHLAITAQSLEEGLAFVERALGVEVPPGGAHPAMGTHNRLMALGPELYLEIIAIDPAAPRPARPRWYGLDGLDGVPSIGTWVLSTPDIESTLAGLPSSVGPAIPMARGDLSWMISVPKDGSMPQDGAFPSLIQWPNGSPAPRMRDLGCRLHRLTVEHPGAEAINAALKGHFHDPRVEVRPGPVKSIVAEFETPLGRCVLQ